MALSKASLAPQHVALPNVVSQWSPKRRFPKCRSAKRRSLGARSLPEIRLQGGISCAITRSLKDDQGTYAIGEVRRSIEKAFAIMVNIYSIYYQSQDMTSYLRVLDTCPHLQDHSLISFARVAHSSIENSTPLSQRLEYRVAAFLSETHMKPLETSVDSLSIQETQ